MKRSEMVDLIFNTIMECYMQDMSTMEIAEVVLKKEEKAGMLPPPRDTDPESWIGELPPGYGCEWEPEDDESLESNIPKCDFCSSPCGFEHCSAKDSSAKDSIVVKPKRGR